LVAGVTIGQSESREPNTVLMPYIENRRG
jgi:hypothetical protein